MEAQYEPGRYLVRVLDQYFGKSQYKGTLKFSLAIRVLKNLDKPDEPCKPHRREATWWITDDTVKDVLRDLRTLGYAGDRLAGVDPDTENFHDFKDKEIELYCSHDPDKEGNVWERWTLRAGRQNLKDKTELRRFDRMLAKQQGPANAGAEEGGQGISDEDVPF